MAEIRVPACPIPIQNTKLVMSQAQPTGMVQSPGADPGGNLIAEAEKTETGNSRGDGEGNPPPARRAILHRAGDALRNPAVSSAGSIPAADEPSGRSREAISSLSVSSGAVVAPSMLFGHPELPVRLRSRCETFRYRLGILRLASLRSE